jgi:hypothetical protein
VYDNTFRFASCDLSLLYLQTSLINRAVSDAFNALAATSVLVV